MSILKLILILNLCFLCNCSAQAYDIIDNDNYTQQNNFFWNSGYEQTPEIDGIVIIKKELSQIKMDIKLVKTEIRNDIEQYRRGWRF